MSIYDNIGLATTSSTALADAAKASTDKNRTSLGQEDFLSLLTTQLANQDPTQPVDNSQMVSQLSQLSMVESLATLNETADSLSSSLNSSQALMASSFVGTEVRLSSNSGYFNGSDAMQFCISAGDDNVSDMTLTITDEKGQIINSVELGSSTGDMNLYWDGTDSSGNKVTGGNYTFSVNGKVNGTTAEIPVYTYGKVSSVTLGSTLSEATLNIEGGGTVSMSQVGNFG